MFRRKAFLPAGADPRTFHEKALEEGKFYEERVAEDLSNKVFGEVFPDLVRAIVKAAPEADLQEVREAALILLYRLLFILYAEDRDLLPVKDTRYDDYGLRNKVRLDVKERKDKNDVFSETAARYWGVDTQSRTRNPPIRPEPTRAGLALTGQGAQSAASSLVSAADRAPPRPTRPPIP